MANEVLTRIEGNVLVITLNRPAAKNAADRALSVALAAAIDELIDFIQGEETNEGAARCAAIALTKFEEGCMWAVKAIEKPDISV